MKVWIDQDLCTGDGLCEEVAPDVFVLLSDGLAYVREGDTVYAAENGNPQGAAGGTRPRWSGRHHGRICRRMPWGVHLYRKLISFTDSRRQTPDATLQGDGWRLTGDGRRATGDGRRATQVSTTRYSLRFFL